MKQLLTILRLNSLFLLLLSLIWLSILPTQTTQAQTLYGVTFAGGEDNIGAIVKYDNATSSLTAPVSMQTIAGREPVAEVVEYQGKFYGMTSKGGINDVGVIFEWNPITDEYIRKIDFSTVRGTNPKGNLTLLNGKFYGTTSQGGSNNRGVIFEWNPATNEYIKKIDFDYTNGGRPNADLTLLNGVFYGTASEGGANGGSAGGTIFEWNPTTNLYTKKVDFSNANGYSPQSNLVFFDGKFYGNTQLGGVNGFGTLFEWNPTTNVYTKKIDLPTRNGYMFGGITLWNNKFYGMSAGASGISSGVIFEWDPVTNINTEKIDFAAHFHKGGKGNLTIFNNRFYGIGLNSTATQNTIFFWDPTTNQYILQRTFNGQEGMLPQGSLVSINGRLYGTTSSGGSANAGVLFEFNAFSNTLTKKLDFQGNKMGQNPLSSMTFYNGKFYGVTYQGGVNNIGVIFEWNPTTDTYTKKIEFASQIPVGIGNSGGYPAAPLTLFNGKFYGTTLQGGGNDQQVGVIFEWNPVTNEYTRKFSFIISEGNNTLSQLVEFEGKLYGTTALGGANNLGVIFEWNPFTNVYTKKVDLDAQSGNSMYGSLVLLNNKFYGMTRNGGSNNLGVMFEWNPTTNVYTKKVDLNIATGYSPLGDLSVFEGKLYGSTRLGGTNNYGTLFEWNPTTNIYTKKIELDSVNGKAPYSNLNLVNGKFYGMSSEGGSFNKGVVFEWNPTTNTYIKKADFNGTNGSTPSYGKLLLAQENPCPEINIQSNGATISSINAIPIITNGTNFGDVVTSKTVTYTIQNLATADLTVSSIGISGADASDFVLGNFTTNTLVSGASFTTFTVTFTPSSLAVKNATLTINSNDCDESVYTFNIQGTGTDTEPALTNSFRTTWITNDGTIKINTNGGGYNYNLTWTNLSNTGVGNGSITGQTGVYIITGLTNGDTYEVAITGIYPQFFMGINNSERLKIRTIEEWGTGVWRSMNFAFNGCANLRYNATDIPNLTMVQNTAGMFGDCSVFEGNATMNNWDMSTVTTIGSMFRNASSFNQNIGSWNTSAVTNMGSVFSGASSFNQSIENWNTTMVTEMGFMFHKASSFNQDISNWNTSAVISMSAMFQEASSFNQNIGNWNTAAVTSMLQMFWKATSFNQNIGNWNTAAVTQMYRIFQEATSFNQNIGNWNISNVADMSNMLSNSGLSTQNYDATLIGWASRAVKPNVNLGATGLKYCNSVTARNILTSAPNNWNITGDAFLCPFVPFRTTWITTDGTITIPTTGGGYNYTVTWTNLTNTGVGNGSATARTGNYTITGLTNGDTYEIAISGAFPQFFMNNNATEKSKLYTIEQWGDIAWASMESAFYGCQNLTYNATDNPNLTMVTDMSTMFLNCINFNGNIGNWNTATITDMEYMFQAATSFNQDIGNWNTTAVTSMRGIFIGATAFNQNIGNWNTEHVIDMGFMFYGATAFNQNIGNWNTSAVINMGYMFYGATSFNQNIGNWNTTSVTNMQIMFFQASSFNQDIRNWNISSVNNTDGMFYGATSFNQNLGNWNTVAINSMGGMFYGATSFNQNLGNWNVSNVENMAEMLSNSGLSTQNYDATLIGWASRTVKPNLTLGAISLKYCNSVTARSILTSAPNNWTITGDQLLCLSLLSYGYEQTQINDCLPSSTIADIDVSLTGSSYLWSNATTNQDLTDVANGIYSLTIDGTTTLPVIVGSPVEWQNPIRATLTNEGRIVANGTYPWNLEAAATSKAKLESGENGGFTIVVEDMATISNVMIGLAQPNNVSSYVSLGNSFYIAPNGDLYVYWNGMSILKANSTVVVGDRITILREGTSVKYYHNQNLVYTDTQTANATKRLVVDIALTTGTSPKVWFSKCNPTSFDVKYTQTTLDACNTGAGEGSITLLPQAGTAPYTYLWANGSAPIANPTGMQTTLTSVQVTDANTNSMQLPVIIGNPVNWTSLQNVSASQGQLGAIGASGYETGGAISETGMGANTNGGITYIYQATSAGYMMGLSPQNTNPSWTSLGYSTYIENNIIYIYEGSSLVHSSVGIADQDRISIIRVGSEILYYRNSQELHRITVNPNVNLFADATVATGQTPAIYASWCTTNLGLTYTQTAVDDCTTGGSEGAISLQGNGGAVAYTYTWTGGNTDNPRTGLPRGLYEVTLGSGATNFVSPVIVGGFVNWADLTTNTTQVGGTITATTSASWTTPAGGLSSNRLAASTDGGISYVIPSLNEAGNYQIGLSPTSAVTSSWEGIGYSAWIGNSNKLFIYQSGTLVNTVGSVSAGDRISIIRRSGNIEFYINSTLVHTFNDVTIELAADISVIEGTSPVVYTSFCNTGFRIANKVTTTQNETHFEEDTFSIYPNPSTGIFNVRFGTVLPENTQVTIFDGIGRKVGIQTFEKGNQKFSIDLKNQPKGMYLIHFNQNGATYSKSIIIE